MSANLNMPEDLALQAALDGELDAAGTLAFEQAMAQDAQLAARYRQLLALQKAVREKLPVHPVPPLLRQSMEALVARQARTARAPVRGLSRRDMFAYAATALVAAGLGAGVTFLARSPGQSAIALAIIGAHRRGLLATSALDVVTSDLHTVRPWFDVHLGISPPVPDLTAQGYTLLGGRVDIVADAPVPALVYRLRAHLVSVTAVPLARAAGFDAASISNGGYRLQAWRDDSFVFFAVADIAPAELAAFVAAFQQSQRL